MTSQQILHADVLDILFQHRNKMYGAYQLRRTYALRLLSPLLFTFLAIAFLLWLLSLKGKENIFISFHNKMLAAAPSVEVKCLAVKKVPSA